MLSLLCSAEGTKVQHLGQEQEGGGGESLGLQAQCLIPPWENVLKGIPCKTVSLQGGKIPLLLGKDFEILNCSVFKGMPHDMALSWPVLAGKGRGRIKTLNMGSTAGEGYVMLGLKIAINILAVPKLRCCSCT